MNTKTIYTGLILGVLGLAGANSANAGAIIYNTGSAATATVALGVNAEGHLNTVTGSIVTNSSATGLAYNYPSTIGGWQDATSPGCLCEGWGVSASGVAGHADIDAGGVINLTVDSFVTDALPGSGTYITSTVHLTSLPGLKVTQAYSAADTSTALFKDVVTITNTTGGALTDVRYVRVMDWDIPLTEFSEMVTIDGTGTTTLLELSHDNGFANPNPLFASGQIYPCGITVDFTDCGSADHGAYFRFNFGTLGSGKSVSFTIFYGATATEALANAAVAAEGIELYSYGQTDFGSGSGGDPITGTPATFIFGFKGVGGTPVFPTPEPTSLILLGLGLLGIGALRRRRIS